MLLRDSAIELLSEEGVDPTAQPPPATADQPLMQRSACAVPGVSGAEECRPEKYRWGARCRAAGPTAVLPPDWPWSQRRAVHPLGTATCHL